MCSHYQAVKKREQMERYFRARGIPMPESWTWDMWPRKVGAFIRRPAEWDSGDEAVPDREVSLGRWGLVSSMTRAENLPKALKLSTFNARSETAAKSYTFGNAWRKGQRCIVPAEAFFEPDWRSGKAVATRFTRTDGQPMAIAGLWDRYRDQAGQWQDSYTMLTINADQHPLMREYHRPDDEKRMIVILPEGAYDDWLSGYGDIRDYLNPYPADSLVAESQSCADRGLDG